MSNTSPKIVVIGAGSLFFGRQVIWAVNHLAGLKDATLSLVDTDAKNLSRMAKLAEMAGQTSDASVTVEAHSDYREALPGADFVVLSFSERNAHYRRIDCEISAKYGIRMCSGDTIGPGGVFRTFRELPKILEIAADVERLCPDAWLVNYVNPSAIMGIALMRHSNTKTFALCDGLHLPFRKQRYLNLIGEDPEAHADFHAPIAGVNHFTFMLSATFRGEDVMPRMIDALRARAAEERDVGYSKGRFNSTIEVQMYETFGVFPTCTAHTKEYVPYYQGRGPIQESIPPIAVFDCDERDERTADMWADVDAWIAGTKPMDEFHSSLKSDHATDIIHSMWVGDGRHYFTNIPNKYRTREGSPVENMPADAFFELECAVSMDGPDPIPVGSFPRGIRAQQHLILDVHELTVEACVKRDKTLALRALAMDPLINSIATAKQVMDELFAIEKEALPGW